MSEIKVFVGTDRSQLLAVKVLEYSIKRHTQSEVSVVPLLDLPIKQPIDPRKSQRTGFSFSRFAIPQLCHYQGKAIYLDADMMVFKDIEQLWSVPFGSQTKIVIQKHLDSTQASGTGKVGAPAKRIRQCAVMVIDCSRSLWDAQAIVDGLDRNEYTYESLMYDLCILKNDEIKEVLPFEWNSLEHYDKDTCLIHYTDMATQPWISPFNKHGYLWLEEVNRMIYEKKISVEEIEHEINLGYFRPSLILELKAIRYLPRFFSKRLAVFYAAYDRAKKFKAHKEVYEQKKRRLHAIKEFEAHAQSQKTV